MKSGLCSQSFVRCASCGVSIASANHSNPAMSAMAAHELLQRGLGGSYMPNPYYSHDRAALSYYASASKYDLCSLAT